MLRASVTALWKISPGTHALLRLYERGVKEVWRSQEESASQTQLLKFTNSKPVEDPALAMHTGPDPELPPEFPSQWPPASFVTLLMKKMAKATAGHRRVCARLAEHICSPRTRLWSIQNRARNWLPLLTCPELQPALLVLTQILNKY